jgi:hypothetical protein
MTGDFELTIDELREVADFAVQAAEAVLPSFEVDQPDDVRPRAAIDATRAFIGGEPRSNLQRTAAVNAHRAAREASTEPARLAAQAAGDAAAAAFLHPISQASQVGHILRAAANEIHIEELAADEPPAAVAAAIQRVVERATAVMIDVLCRYPSASGRGARPAQLMAELDAALRLRRR